MDKQNYDNHIRYYIPHHFFFYSISLLLLGLCIYKATSAADNTIWLIMAAMVTMTTWLSYMLRQHYALNNQNRIVRLEMRLRYYALTKERLEPIEEKLTFKQLAALRFASDEELLPLIQRALREHLKPKDIKKSIRNWQADHMRV